MRQQKFLIGFALLVISTFALGCKKENGYRTEVIVCNPSLNQCTNDFEGRINTTTQFLASFIDSYRRMVKSSVRKEFYEKFPFLVTNLGSRVLFSEMAETMLTIHPSRTNSLTVDCVHLPAQLVVFSGLESDSKLRLLISEEDLLRQYRANGGFFTLPERASSFVSRIAFVSGMPKLATVPSNSLLLVQEIGFVLTNASLSRTLRIDDVAIFTGGLDFGATLSIATEFGKTFAEFDITDLFMSSELFRASLAHPELKTIAEEIVKKSERKKSGGEEYAYWQFLSDKNRLVEAAKRWGVSTAYADDFFRDYRSGESGETLFW